MKKVIITTAIILTTAAIATSGVKLINNKEQKVQITLATASNPVSGKEIASAD